MTVPRRISENKTMTSRKAPPKSITEYINAAPKETRKKLREMRACIRTSAPRGQGKPEVGDARLFLSEDTGHVRRVQTSHRLLSHAVSSESLRELSFEICHG